MIAVSVEEHSIRLSSCSSHYYMISPIYFALLLPSALFLATQSNTTPLVSEALVFVGFLFLESF